MLTNKLGLPQPFVDAATSKHKYTPRRYSVSDFLGGTCEAILKRRHHGESEEDVSDRLWSILGTAVHNILYNSKESDTQMKEVWASRKVETTNGTYDLSGIFDLYDDNTKTVTDWKTCSVWKACFGDYSDWRKQTLTYCWLLRGMGFDASNGEIVAMMRDHSKRKAMFDKDYPPYPVKKIAWEFTEDDFSQLEDDIREWFQTVSEQEKLSDDELTPCPDSVTWTKPETWAVVRDGNKRASKVLDDPDEAAVFCENMIEKTGKPHHVEHREAEHTRCELYCSVSRWCVRKKYS